MQDQTVIEHIASRLAALTRCADDWTARHNAALDMIEREYLPSGSGIDSGTRIDRERSTAKRIVLTTAFHHMDGGSGMYDGWTDHTIVATPSFIGGFSLRVTGRDRDGIKDYLAGVYDVALRAVIPHEAFSRVTA